MADDVNTINTPGKAAVSAEESIRIKETKTKYMSQMRKTILIRNTMTTDEHNCLGKLRKKRSILEQIVIQKFTGN